MQEISQDLAKQLAKETKNDLQDKEFYTEGRNDKFIFTAYQVDCLGYEWLESRIYKDGSQKFFTSK